MDAARAIAAGEGPVALDAERASGYRYGQRAYLVQLRREGSGTWLIDPIACPDLSPVNDAIGSAEWILHAATQDLACLAEVGLRPAAAVRHRARRAPAGPAAGRPGRRRRALPRASRWPRSTRPSTGPPGRCPSRGCATPRSTSRCSSTLRNLMGVDLATPGQGQLGARGVRGAARLHRSRAAGRPVAAHQRHAPGPAPPDRRRRARAVGDPRPDRPGPRRLPRPGAARRRARRGRDGVARPTPAPCPAGTARSAATSGSGSTPSPGPTRSPKATCRR